MTPIWPNVRDRPSAASNRIEPRVGLQVRVRLDRAGGLPHRVDETIGLDLADARRLGDVVVLAVDGHLALGGVEADPAGVLLNGLDVERSGLLDGVLPQVHRDVGGFHRIGGGLLGILDEVLVGLDEGVVHRGVDGLVVVPRRQLAGDILHPDTADLFLCDRDRDHGHRLRGQADILVLAEERHIGVSVEGVEHGVGVGAADLVDDGGEVGRAQWRVVLALDLDAVLFGVGLDDPVGGLREHIVTAHEIERLDALLLEVVQRRHDLLVGGGAGVEDVLARLQTFVLHGVVEQGVGALEHGQHGLAARRGPATEHRGHAVTADQLLGLLGEHRGLGGPVLADQLDLFAQNPALGVDLLDRELDRIAHRHLGNGHRA